MRNKTLEALDLDTYNEFVQHLDDHLRKGVKHSFPHMFAMKSGASFPLSIPDFEELRTHDAAGAMCVHMAGNVPKVHWYPFNLGS